MSKITYCTNIDESQEKYNKYIKNHINAVIEAHHTAIDAFKEVFPEVYESEAAYTMLMHNLRDHDKSKFGFDEYWCYLSKFFPYEDMKIITEDKINKNFELGWLHHIHHNAHHPAHWVLPDNREFKILDMPDIYIIEMLCDWMAMSKYFKSTTLEYWNTESAKQLPMSIRTVSKVDEFMKWMEKHNVHTLW
jgi:hypothetical protein